jgi:Ni,Fe-hydrogenase I large subunit
MTHVVVDPVTRIEGHLRVEANVENGAVQEAWASATAFRGIELILKGRDPRDAWVFTQRICGVCTTVHAIASVRAVEDAIGAVPPPNARLLRNLIMATQAVQDHVIHFYHLHALDWVDVASALEADVARTASLAQSISDWPLSSTRHFALVKSRLRSLLDRGQLGIFASAYWGHPAYRLPPEANLLAVAHYLDALDWQRGVIAIHALLGGKNPHPQSFLVGGMSTPIDPDRQTSLNANTIGKLRKLAVEMRAFVKRVYIPDVIAIASAYKDWARIGGGLGSYLSVGEYPEADGKEPPLFLPGGLVRGRDLLKTERFDPALVNESVSQIWHDQPNASPELLASRADAVSRGTGPTPPAFERADVLDKHSWLKSPRYGGEPMEVGPLARMVIAYAGGHARVKELVDGLLCKLGVGTEALFSTLGRTVARAVETQLLCGRVEIWIDALANQMSRGDLRTHDSSKWEPTTWPDEAFGSGLHEAPRGSLGHWVHIKDRRIANYQAVVPTTWNAGPRDANGKRGPAEAALIGTPVVDPQQPIELLRTIHSFDPCMACGVHVYDASGRTLGEMNTKA